MLTQLEIIDNSGAITGKIIKLLNKKSQLKTGSLVLVSIVKTIPNSKIRKGDICKAIVVNGEYKSLTNTVKTKKSLILVKLPPKGNEFIPIANRIKLPSASLLRNRIGMNKILSLSKKNL